MLDILMPIVFLVIFFFTRKKAKYNKLLLFTIFIGVPFALVFFEGATGIEMKKIAVTYMTDSILVLFPLYLLNWIFFIKPAERKRIKEIVNRIQVLTVDTINEEYRILGSITENGGDVEDVKEALALQANDLGADAVIGFNISTGTSQRGKVTSSVGYFGNTKIHDGRYSNSYVIGMGTAIQFNN